MSIKKDTSNNIKSKELGFGNRVSSKNLRSLNKDGSFNVRRSGGSIASNWHIYHRLIEMSWLKFALLVFVTYTIINSIFAAVYLLFGIEHLLGVIGKSFVDKFWEAFFFSAQTLTTVGYGRISPEGFSVSMIAAVESMVGLMGFAIITGLMYGKFARPTAKIMFSEKAIIAPYKGINAFQFRIVNERKNQLLELEIQVLLSMNKITDGVEKNVFLELDLETKKINFFPLPWTIVHPIDEKSPLVGYTQEMLDKSNAEIIILLKAYDDNFSQNVYRRFSYTANEIEWGAKFNVIYDNDEDGFVNLKLDLFQHIQKVPLNPITTV